MSGQKRNKFFESPPTMSTNIYIEKRYEDIIKSKSDDRLYRGLLLTNKMKVLLISDSTTDKSAAALNINIGYMCDPNDLPGLAHFCEHMLFLGTEKYPQQNDYNMYLSQNGGTSNASTHSDHTFYYFDIIPDKLEGALDRFAQFFLKPLFTETLTELELNAINSEHEQNLATDSRRFDQINKSSASPDHPFSKFGNGNRQTLDIIPKQKGINIREKLLEFYEKYYSSNIMSLCILGKESLDELENMVANLFWKVKNKEIKVPEWPEHPFKDEHFRTKWYIVPIKDLKTLNMLFPLPDIRQYYRSLPTRYISYLLGHEGKGSLVSALQAKGWCDILVSAEQNSARGFNFFCIGVSLTEIGIKYIDDIVTMTFQYINMLKKTGPTEWIFNECSYVANVNFRFKEKCFPRIYVSTLVHSLQKYPMNEVLCAEEIYSEWRPDVITKIMEYLTPQNIRIHVAAKAYKNIANETETWYGTKYKKEKILSEVINMWENVSENPELRLPSKNEFIATQFDIKDEANVEKFPTIIEDTPFVRLWFKKDDEYLVPRASMIFNFVSPLAYMNPISCNLSMMFINLLRDSLNEYTHAANLAGLKWEPYITKYGITISISGYNEKQCVLLEKIIDRMINFEVDPKKFDSYKENYIRVLKNFAAEQPYKHANYYIEVLLSERVWITEELLEAIAYLSVDRLQQFIPQFLSKVHVECLIHGNITKTEAINMVRLIEFKLTNTLSHITPLVQRQLILSREIRLEDGCHFLFEIENKVHISSCTEVYYQSGLDSTESNMLLQLLAQIISEPCFDMLRTKEQLGYIVYSGVSTAKERTPGLEVVVQSDRHPQYVEKRIDLFMNSMLNHILTMSEEQFDKHKKALATLRLEKPKMLNDRCNMFWREIVSQQYNFDRANIEVAYLKTITQQQLLNFYKKIIHSEARHKLSIHVISTADDTPTKDNVYDKNDEIFDIPDSEKIKKIDDILSFKLSQSYYPLPKPFNEFPRKGIHSSKFINGTLALDNAHIRNL